MALCQWLPQSEKGALLSEIEALHFQKTNFLTPFVQRREMGHSVPTKGFLQLSLEAAMLFASFGCTRQPPPCPALSADPEPKVTPRTLLEVT